MFPRLLRRLAPLLVLLLASPAAASAASVDVAVSPDPLIDRPVTFTSSAVTDGQELFVYARIRPLDANPCAATYDGATGDQLFFRLPGGEIEVKTYDTAQPLVICAYLSENSNTAPVATATIPFTVRANRASVALVVPPTATQETGVPIGATGTTEVARNLFVKSKPLGAGPCGPTWGADGGSNVVFNQAVTGPFAVPENAGPFRDAGQYALCAWVQKSSSSAVADAASAAVIRIAPPRPVLSEIRLSSARFNALSFGGSITRSFSGGTNITVSVNTPSTLRFTVQRARSGRRVGSSCRVPTRALRNRRSCLRYVPVRGAFDFEADRNTNFVRFSGRIGRRQLARGRYRFEVTARNETGRSETRRRTFRIVGR